MWPSHYMTFEVLFVCVCLFVFVCLFVCFYCFCFILTFVGFFSCLLVGRELVSKGNDYQLSLPLMRLSCVEEKTQIS